jgi:anti-anti-sigma factor
MNIAIEDRAGVKLVTLAGELTGEEECGELVRTVGDALAGPGARAVIDMGSVEYISSTGISALVRITAQANTQEQRVVFASPAPLVAGVFEATRLNKFFEIFPTVEDAVAALRG